MIDLRNKLQRDDIRKMTFTVGVRLREHDGVLEISMRSPIGDTLVCHAAAQMPLYDIIHEHGEEWFLTQFERVAGALFRDLAVRRLEK